MCLGVPARILEVRDTAATAELSGVRREVSVMLLDDVRVGDWVIVHAGFAIEKLSEEEARQTLSLFREISESDGIR